MARIRVAELRPGTNGYIVQVVNGVPSWVPSTSAGSVATDSIWDAKGDIAVASGADAASKLAVGSNGQVLTADSAEALGVKWAAAGGSVATDTIFNAKGDLPVGTGSDTASRLGVGTNGQVLTADSAEATGVKWAVAPAGGGIIAYVAYNPNSLATYTTTSTSFGDIDATNLAITFTAPSSGNVLVRLTAFAKVSTVAAVQFWALREGSTTLTGTPSQIINSQTGLFRLSLALPITGLTASSSHTYKWAWRNQSTSTTSTLYAGGVTDGNEVGPAVLEVHALP